MLRRRLLKDSGVDWSKEYLTFIPTVAATTFKYINSAITQKLEYSLDNGGTWTTLASDTDSPPVAVRQKIMWRGTRGNFNNSRYYRIFQASNYFSACGNPLSTVLSDQFIGVDDLTGKTYCICNLFISNNYIVDASNLYLGFTTLVHHCYYCMFKYCTSLTTAPALPATTLAANCYGDMFRGCTSLTTAPVLPATTLVNGCYGYMFYGCSNLNYIKAMFTTKPDTSYVNRWVEDVASSGTFVKNSAATWNVTGSSGVPSGWTVQTASE